MMSPDDIDALIANMNADTQAEKSEIDEISIGDLVSLDDVQVEEKPPMPDMSDPNKTMSPDEIAALIANMT